MLVNIKNWDYLPAAKTEKFDRNLSGWQETDLNDDNFECVYFLQNGILIFNYKYYI